MLYASVATSLFSHFLLAFDGQWSNQRAPVDVGASAAARALNMHPLVIAVTTGHLGHPTVRVSLFLWQVSLLLFICGVLQTLSTTVVDLSWVFNAVLFYIIIILFLVSFFLFALCWF